MNIGETIKRLRKQKDMTQEQLAEYLDISPQAISRWEINSTLPDITLIPKLANIFDVTTDMLLGVDIDTKEKRIDAIRQEANNFNIKKQYNEAENLLRKALKEYPNDCSLMNDLASTLSLKTSFYNRNWNEEEKKMIDEERKVIRKEIITLCEKTLAKCTEDSIRYSSIQRLCGTYALMGDYEKAKAYADKMPHKRLAKEYLIAETLHGTEKFNYIRTEIAKSVFYDVLNSISSLKHIKLDDGSEPYNSDEWISINHKMIDIIHILMEEGSFGDFDIRLAFAHLDLTFLYIQKHDSAAALNHFKLATKHAVMYDSMPLMNDNSSTEYSSLLFQGIPYPFNMIHMPITISNHLLERSHELDSVLPTSELEDIRNELRRKTAII